GRKLARMRGGDRGGDRAARTQAVPMPMPMPSAERGRLTARCSLSDIVLLGRGAPPRRHREIHAAAFDRAPLVESGNHGIDVLTNRVKSAAAIPVDDVRALPDA